jgi:hypothetical protein
MSKIPWGPFFCPGELVLSFRELVLNPLVTRL